MSEKIYPKGLYVNKPREGSPDFVKGRMSIKVADLHEWLNANQGLANDKGYINLDILNGKEDYYCVVNTYKPKQQNNPNPREEYYTPKEPVVDDDSIPF